MSLTPNQVQIIKSTAPVLAEHGNNITNLFYSNLILENPSLKNVFNRTNQVNGQQPAALAGALYAYASNIDNLGALKDAVEKICQKHASLFITAGQYGIVAKYLLAAMGEILGSALTPEILDAWKAAYWQLANLMISRERDLYSRYEDWTTWRNFTITKKVKESSRITSFYLSPIDKKPLPLFKPGQYISVQTRVEELACLQSRQYSLSDAPNTAYYRISVKKEDPTKGFNHAYISNILHNEKQEGDTLEISPPYGEFFLSNPSAPTPLILISAGVGLTPLISILNSLITSQSTRPISWIHAARDTSSQAFGSHIRDICKVHSNVSAKVFVKNVVEGRDREGVDYEVVGRMDLGKLDGVGDLFLGVGEAEYFVCGPEGFMEGVRRGLVGMGVGRERVRLEVFGTGGLD